MDVQALAFDEPDVIVALPFAFVQPGRLYACSMGQPSGCLGSEAEGDSMKAHKYRRRLTEPNSCTRPVLFCRLTRGIFLAFHTTKCWLLSRFIPSKDLS